MKPLKVVLFVVGMLAVAFSSPASAGDTSVGVRLEFVGGPCISGVVSQRLGTNTVLKFAVGGFPGIILRLQANLAFAPDRDGTFFGTGGVGYNRYYRGQANGHGLVELHSGVGYSWRAGSSAVIAPEAGLLYIPTSANPWIVDVWKSNGGTGPKLPLVPYGGVDVLHNAE